MTGGSHTLEQVPGIYRRRIGNAIVTALSDGYLEQQFEQMQGADIEQMKATLQRAHRPPNLRISVNAFAIQHDNGAILIDAGTGSALGPHAGRLGQALAAAGIDPQDVDKVLLTHAHVDHASGLIGAEGGRCFPNATVFVNEEETAFWFDDERMSRADDIRKRACGFVRAALNPYRDRLETFRWGDRPAGLETLRSNGHTPGHTCFKLTSDGEALLFWGDIVHVPELQIPNPDITIVFDVNPADAVRSRRAMLELAAHERLLVAGAHLHFPGLCHIDRNHQGFAFVPEPRSSVL